MSQKPILQSFRVAPWCQTPSSASFPDIIKITAVYDQLTEKHVLLWRDILLPFPNAQCILDVDVLVFFAEKANFEQLMPLRIHYREGKVLDVVLSSTPHESSTSTETYALPAEIIAPPVETAPRLAETAALPVAPPTKTSSLLVEPLVEPLAFPAKTSASFAKENKVHNQPLSSAEPAESTISKLSVHDQVIKISPTPTSTPKVITKWPPQNIIPLKDIQFRIPGIYPHSKYWSYARTPRLFILLPSTAAVAARLSEPHQQVSPNQLRLYFFCESHDGRPTQEKVHWVHLSQRVGCRIARPTMFLKEFGAYILTVMEAVRKGLAQGSESNCTPAAKLAQELNELEKEEIRLWKSKRPASSGAMEYVYTEDNVTDMLDNMIVYLKTQAQKNSKTWRKPGKLDKGSWKEWGGIWRHIDTELRKSIPNTDILTHLFGNLHQCFSNSGHCQLICEKHAESHVQDEAIPVYFRGMVDGAFFAECIGCLVIDALSPSEAQTLYDILVQAKRVHELDVTFNWDVSMTDLQEFSSAILQSTVVNLRLHITVPEANTEFVSAGITLRAPMDDKRARRYEPFLSMLAKGKIEQFSFNGLPDLFWPTSELLATKAFPSVRTMDSRNSKIETQILKKFTALKVLKMSFIDILHLTPSEKLDFVSACPTLEVIEMYTPTENQVYLNPAKLFAKQLFHFVESIVQQKTTAEKKTRFGLTSLRVNFLGGEYFYLDFVAESDGTFSPRISIFLGTRDGKCLQPIIPDLVTKYGWAIQELSLERSWDPLNVRALLKSIQDKVGKDGISNLEALRLPRCPLNFYEMVPLQRILERSPGLQKLDVSMACAGVDHWRPETSRQDYLNWIVKYLGPWLTHLSLDDCFGWNTESTQPRLLHKSSLPRLEHLNVSFAEDLVNDFDWLIEVIASHASFSTAAATTTAAAASAAPFDPYRLSSFVLDRVDAKKDKTRDLWKKLLGVIDFSVLKTLFILNSEAFGEEQWKTFLGSLPKDGVWADGTLVCLDQVFFKGTSLAANTLDSRAHQLFKRAHLAQLVMIPSKEET